MQRFLELPEAERDVAALQLVKDYAVALCLAPVVCGCNAFFNCVQAARPVTASSGTRFYYAAVAAIWALLFAVAVGSVTRRSAQVLRLAFLDAFGRRLKAFLKARPRLLKVLEEILFLYRRARRKHCPRKRKQC